VFVTPGCNLSVQKSGHSMQIKSPGGSETLPKLPKARKDGESP